MKYEGKDEYKIYNLNTIILNINKDVKIDERNLYKKSNIIPQKQSNDDWSSSDEFSITKRKKFDQETNKFPQRNTNFLFFLSKNTFSSGNQDPMVKN